MQPLRLATATFDLGELHDLLADEAVTARMIEGLSGLLGVAAAGIVDEQMCRHTGADLWANDAAEGVRLIRGTVAKLRGS